MHKLADQLPRELCVNYEQSDKPKPSGELTQEAMDRALALADARVNGNSVLNGAVHTRRFPNIPGFAAVRAWE